MRLPIHNLLFCLLIQVAVIPLLNGSAVAQGVPLSVSPGIVPTDPMDPVDYSPQLLGNGCSTYSDYPCLNPIFLGPRNLIVAYERTTPTSSRWIRLYPGSPVVDLTPFLNGQALISFNRRGQILTANYSNYTLSLLTPSGNSYTTQVITNLSTIGALNALGEVAFLTQDATPSLRKWSNGVTTTIRSPLFGGISSTAGARIIKFTNSGYVAGEIPGISFGQFIVTPTRTLHRPAGRIYDINNSGTTVMCTEGATAHCFTFTNGTQTNLPAAFFASSINELGIIGGHSSGSAAVLIDSQVFLLNNLVPSRGDINFTSIRFVSDGDSFIAQGIPTSAPSNFGYYLISR